MPAQTLRARRLVGELSDMLAHLEVRELPASEDDALALAVSALQTTVFLLGKVRVPVSPARLTVTARSAPDGGAALSLRLAK